MLQACKKRVKYVKKKKNIKKTSSFCHCLTKGCNNIYSRTVERNTTIKKNITTYQHRVCPYTRSRTFFVISNSCCPTSWLSLQSHFVTINL